MTAPNPEKTRTKPSDREQRLKAALKANMARRKAQARQRATEDGEQAETAQDKD